MSSPPVVKHSRGKPISFKEKNVVLNVHKYLKSKHDDLTQQSLTALTAQTTGISKRSIYRIITEKRSTGKLQTPGKQREGAKGKYTRMKKIDDFTKCAIRRKVHDFFARNEMPTLKKSLQQYTRIPTCLIT